MVWEFSGRLITDLDFVCFLQEISGHKGLYEMEVPLPKRPAFFLPTGHWKEGFLLEEMRLN